MRVTIRADAAPHIGTGHVMRCLTLASALRDVGADVIFVSRAFPGNLVARIQAQGFLCHSLPFAENVASAAQGPPHAAWLGVPWQQDALQTQAILKAEGSVDLLVVDHYALDARWQKALRALTDRIMVIDDLADRSHDADLLLDQTVGRRAEDYRPLVPASCCLLTGADYALLRPEFSAFRDRALARRADPPERPHVLISFGGVDSHNMTQRAITGLAQLGPQRLDKATVVLGANAPNAAAIKAAAEASCVPARVISNTPAIAELMVEADLALGAAGTTSWERCALGLPSLLIVLAANQRTIAANLEKAGAAHTIGEAKTITATTFAEGVDKLLSDHQGLRNMGEAAARICDGKGCKRVIDAFRSAGLMQ